MKTNFFLLLTIALLFFGSIGLYAQKDWAVPEYAKGLKNPFVGNALATAEGNLIYSQMCVLCHGISGKGNGEAGLSLEKKPANFLALKDLANEADGEIFWKITTGNPPMASYDELLTEDQRWKLVNYIRELYKKK
jgi:mono/diheme cytochrome c family protein